MPLILDMHQFFKARSLLKPFCFSLFINISNSNNLEAQSTNNFLSSVVLLENLNMPGGLCFDPDKDISLYSNGRKKKELINLRVADS